MVGSGPGRARGRNLRTGPGQNWVNLRVPVVLGQQGIGYPGLGLILGGPRVVILGSIRAKNRPNLVNDQK